MRSQPTTYRVCWANGHDALYDEWASPLRAVVLDTALEYAKKVSKKWKDCAVVWECAPDGTCVRAYGIDGVVKWPVRCNACKGQGKVKDSWGDLVNCKTCTGQGKVPEQ